MAEGFLSRWSRRKAGTQEEPSEPPKESAPPSVTQNSEKVIEAPEAPPSMTMEDVEKIDRFAPDFSAFMKPDVDPAVQQAALKKMFSDPHFNVMDGLDIYIDDYSKPDPLPAGMLERMVQSDMLQLFQKADSAVDKSSQPDEKPSVTNTALDQSSKSDLTSSKSSALEQSANLDGKQIESDQKKT